jgi:hypothetical protein
MHNDYERLKKQIVHLSKLNDYEIKEKADDLGLPIGWDSLPNKRVGKWAASSIIAYRGNNIWLFKFDTRWDENSQYDLTLFKDYPNYPGLEDIVWQVVWTEKGVERLPIELNLN